MLKLAMSQITETDWLAKAFGAVPARQIAEIIDQPGLEQKINQSRRLRLSTRLVQEANSALATYGLFNLRTGPIWYGLSIVTDLAGTVVRERDSWVVHEEVMSPIKHKITSIMPMFPLVNLELSKRGHDYHGNYPWQLWYKIKSAEDSEVGLTEKLTLARPLIQALSASQDIPLPIIGLAATLSYGLIPAFAKIGEIGNKLRTGHNLALDSATHTRYFTGQKLWEKVEGVRKNTRDALKKFGFGEIVLSRLENIGFFAAALVTSSEAVGLLNFMRQMYSVPESYNRLVQQKKENKRDLAFVDDVYNIMSGNPYFLTDASWNRHRLSRLKQLGSPDLKLSSPGIQICNFQTRIPDGKEKHFAPPLSVEAKPGEVVWLVGESGKGKSITTGRGLAGLLEAKGQVKITDKNNQSFWLESFCRTELSDRVWYVQPIDGFDGLRACDIYQERAMQDYCDRTEKAFSDLNDKELLMLSLPDALLERELFVMAREDKKRGKRNNYMGYDASDSGMNTEGLVPTFPMEIFEKIINFRTTRNHLVESHLRTKGANFQNLKADQEIGTLSSGMKARFMWELSQEMGRNKNALNSGQTKLIVLDEPFCALDKVNVHEYLSLLNELLDSENPPVVILISHTHEDLIDEQLGNKVIKVKLGEEPKS